MSLQPGRFNGASLSTAGGDLHVRITDAGNWQLKVKRPQESDWRLLCTGNLEGGVAAAAPEEHRGTLAIGPLRVDLDRRSATVRGAALDLRAREFDLLATLASDPERIFPKRDLLRDVWGYADGCRTRTLDSHASRVRVKLRRAGAGEMVVNCWGVGYRLTEGVRLASADTPRAA